MKLCPVDGGNPKPPSGLDQMKTVCTMCGQRYGVHSGVSCPSSATKSGGKQVRGQRVLLLDGCWLEVYAEFMCVVLPASTGMSSTVTKTVAGAHGLCVAPACAGDVWNVVACRFGCYPLSKARVILTGRPLLSRGGSAAISLSLRRPTMALLTFGWVPRTSLLCGMLRHQAVLYVVLTLFFSLDPLFPSSMFLLFFFPHPLLFLISIRRLLPGHNSSAHVDPHTHMLPSPPPSCVCCRAPTSRIHILHLHLLLLLLSSSSLLPCFPRLSPFPSRAPCSGGCCTGILFQAAPSEVTPHDPRLPVLSLDDATIFKQSPTKLLVTWPELGPMFDMVVEYVSPVLASHSFVE